LCAFFDHLYPYCDTILSLDGDEIAATATLLPCQIVQPNSDIQDALYLYSLNTLPTFRGRGHAQRLLDAAREKSPRVFLHAADDSLFDMYAARGWRGMMYTRWEELPAEPAHLSIQRLRGEDYLKARENLLQSTAHVRWDTNALQFLDDLLFFGNGGLFASQNAIAAVLSKEDNDCLYIAEALGDDALALARALAHAHDCPRAKVLTPCLPEAPGAFPYAQGVGLPIPDPMYLSFVFL